VLFFFFPHLKIFKHYKIFFLYFEQISPRTSLLATNVSCFKSIYIFVMEKYKKYKYENNFASVTEMILK